MQRHQAVTTARKLTRPSEATSRSDLLAVAPESASAVPASLSDSAVVLRLMHGFDLTVDGEIVSLPWHACRLLAFLALHRRPMLRAHVAGSLWMDKDEERAHANLRSALWRLRQTCDRLVDTDSSNVRLAPGVAVDVERSEALSRIILAEGCRPQADWAEELTGELLPDWYDDWVVFGRERLRQLFLHALERLCTSLCDAGAMAHAVDIGMRALAVDPLRESAHRAVITAHLAEGNRSEALRQYQLCCKMLGDQLSLEPSPALTALVRPLAAAAG